MAFLGSSLPAPGGRTEERGGTSATRRTHHRRPKGPSPGGEGLLFVRSRDDRTEGPTQMTIEGPTPRPPTTSAPADAAAAAQPRAGRRHGRAPPPSSAPSKGDAPRGARPASARGSAPTSLCEALLRQGVDVLFSYPGGVILPALRRPRRLPRAPPRPRPPRAGRRPRRRRLRPRRPARSACAWARPGPGATNLVTGIGTAQLDSIPMVAITGNVPARADRQGRVPGDRHQRHHPADDQAQLPGPRTPTTCPRVIAEAFHIARTGRPGPVHVDITKDALQQETQRRAPDRGRGHRRPARLPAQPRRPLPSSSSSPPPEIAAAKRPVILAGHGVLHAEAWDELLAFAEKTQIPVAWTLLGIGAIDETPPAGLRLHGHARLEARQPGDPVGRPARSRSGMRFDDRVTGNVRTYAPYARIVHVDIDPAEIGKNVAVEVPDRRRREARPRGADADGRRGADRATRAEYLDQLAEWRRDSEGSVVARLGRLARRPAVGRLRRRADRRADRPRGDLRRRRRPEPDVARPLRRLPPARTRHVSSGGLGHDGLRRPGGDGRGARPARRARPGRSPATAASR